MYIKEFFEHINIDDHQLKRDLINNGSIVLNYNNQVDIIETIARLEVYADNNPDFEMSIDWN